MYLELVYARIRHYDIGNLYFHEKTLAATTFVREVCLYLVLSIAKPNACHNPRVDQVGNYPVDAVWTGCGLIVDRAWTDLSTG